MATVPMEYRATLYDLQSKSARQVYLVGEMARADLSVGGGPIIPPDKPPVDPGLHPEHPIYWPPHVEHPIVLPPNLPPIDPPVDPPTNPADPQWVWGYSPKYNAWTPVYVPGEGQAGPKA